MSNICKVQLIQSLSKIFFFLLFIYILIAHVKLITNITLLFKKDLIFMMKFMKYEKRSHFFKYVRFQCNASISSSLRDVALKPFFQILQLKRPLGV